MNFVDMRACACAVLGLFWIIRRQQDRLADLERKMAILIKERYDQIH